MAPFTCSIIIIGNMIDALSTNFTSCRLNLIKSDQNVVDMYQFNFLIGRCALLYSTGATLPFAICLFLGIFGRC